MSELLSACPDIRYRGKLSFRGMRLIALLAMTISQLCIIAIVADRIQFTLNLTENSAFVQTLLYIGVALGQITFPLLLIASFGTVMNGTESVGKSLIFYFSIALVTYLATVFIIYRFLSIVLEMLPAIVSRISVVDEEELGSLSTFADGIWSKVIRNILPGDGTIHLEYINAVMQKWEVAFRIPSMEELQALAENIGIESESFIAVTEQIAAMTPEMIADNLDQLLAFVVNILPIDLETLIRNTAIPRLMGIVTSKMKFNVFWDLFLYTAFYFFSCGHPKNIRGGKLLLFRCCSVFPAGWMVLSAFISANIGITGEAASVALVAALSTRPFSALAVFFLMVLYQKYREAEFAEIDPSGDKWGAFLSTNRCSFQFSLFACGALVLVSLVDTALGYIPALAEWGMGQSSMMWMAFPVLLLYSYRRVPKHKIFNAAVPLYYVVHYAVVIVVLVEVLGNVLV